jgi:hypothetical protein
MEKTNLPDLSNKDHKYYKVKFYFALCYRRDDICFMSKWFEELRGDMLNKSHTKKYSSQHQIIYIQSKHRIKKRNAQIEGMI